MLPYLVVGNHGCIEWTRSIAIHGYGQMSYRGVPVNTHRWLFQYFEGPLESTQYVLHRCNNPPCCNIDHLYIGTHQDIMRGIAERGCKKGERHPSAKLMQSDIHTILHRLAYHDGYTAIAKDYGVTDVVIHSVGSGKTWGWLCV